MPTPTNILVYFSQSPEVLSNETDVPVYHIHLSTRNNQCFNSILTAQEYVKMHNNTLLVVVARQHHTFEEEEGCFQSSLLIHIPLSARIK